MNKELLEKLCLEYGFSWDILGGYIRIVSKRKDTYYFLNVDHEGHKIKLYHGNERNDSNMHKHGKYDNLNCLFKMIKFHDEREIPGRRKDKLSRMTILFNSLHSAHA